MVGFDDIRFARYMDPPLTTVAQPKDELGREAMNMLIEILSRRRRPGAQARLTDAVGHPRLHRAMRGQANPPGLTPAPAVPARPGIGFSNFSAIATGQPRFNTA